MLTCAIRVRVVGDWTSQRLATSNIRCGNKQLQNKKGIMLNFPISQAYLISRESIKLIVHISLNLLTLIHSGA